MALANVAIEQPARYFDLVNKPGALKRTNGDPLTDSELKKVPTNGASLPEDWDVSFGDVLNWSQGRPTEAYFVLEDRTLLKNPDRSGSGYLTIPFNVTKNSRNALLRYEQVIESIGKSNVTTVELHPEDAFITKNWGELSSEILSQNTEFIYDPLEEFLYVNIPHTSKSKEFKLGSTNSKDIQTWLAGAMGDQASFRIKYNFSGPEYQKYHNEYQLHTNMFSLPKTWSVEPGTTDIGHDRCHGEWIFHGDRNHLNEAKKNAQDFYKDLPVTIEDVHRK